MKLFFVPGYCSLAVHIALNEAQLQATLDQVDLASQRSAAGVDYRAINPKGYVPALQLEDGEVLTEVAVIIQYLADQNPDLHLAPPAGTLARYRLQEWLNFIATEIHKGLGQMFNPAMTPDQRIAQFERLQPRLDYVDARLQQSPCLMGDSFSVADIYLFTILNWRNFLDLDFSRWPALLDFAARVAARPAVAKTMQEEGLAG